MKCKDFEENLTFYIENELPDELKKAFEEHLHECFKCRELLNSLIEIKDVLSNFPEFEINESLIQNILKKTKYKRKILFIPYLEPVFAILAALFIVISLLLISKPQKIYTEMEKQLHLIYGEIKEMQVKGESLKGKIMGYKENLFESFKEKNFLLFKFKFLKENPKMEEKNGGKEDNSIFSS